MLSKSTLGYITILEKEKKKEKKKKNCLFTIEAHFPHLKYISFKYEN
jgi:hypothetical protein